eukprot:CAMPEP_0197555502 /NCGR_PEP_ID=MMETSP1320-20131121/13411_1 /TAXON_ID=91990 /ORGANISM="Bolidomonas sp., Strain RCC2347" /LENGTH=75 /DNA_ID=CAMNT_0043116523 /DNA_START=37 /DNA_END=260 /DNA_ORIENTATION=-
MREARGKGGGFCDVRNNASAARHFASALLYHPLLTPLPLLPLNILPRLSPLKPCLVFCSSLSLTSEEVKTGFCQS